MGCLDINGNRVEMEDHRLQGVTPGSLLVRACVDRHFFDGFRGIKGAEEVLILHSNGF